MRGPRCADWGCSDDAPLAHLHPRSSPSAPATDAASAHAQSQRAPRPTRGARIRADEPCCDRIRQPRSDTDADSSRRQSAASRRPPQSVAACAEAAPKSAAWEAPRTPSHERRPNPAAERLRRQRVRLRSARRSSPPPTASTPSSTPRPGRSTAAADRCGCPQSVRARRRLALQHRWRARVRLDGGQVFKLGIPTTITVTPIEFTGGYRRELAFGRARRTPGARRAQGFRLIPFVGGGVGIVRIQGNLRLRGGGRRCG